MSKPDPGAGAPLPGPASGVDGMPLDQDRHDGHDVASPRRDTVSATANQQSNVGADPVADGASRQPSDGTEQGPFAKRPSKRGRRRRRRRNKGAGMADSATPNAVDRNTKPDHQKPISGQAGACGARSPRPAAQPPKAANGAVKNSRSDGPPQPVRPPSRPKGNGPSAPAIRNDKHAATAYAALDLGTNNCRLLVAVPTRPGAFRVIDAFSRIVRLGEGLSATGRLSDEAMDRAVGALKVCQEKLTARPIERTRLIATEACRSAENGARFLDRVRDETGLRLEIVDRETEARLAVAGCGSLVDRSARSTVLFDIGGGSSEIALIDLSQARSRRLADHIVDWTSLPVGVVTMAEKFGGRHVDEDTFAAMTAHAEDLLAGFAATGQIGSELIDDAFHLIGTSGTVTTLAGIHLGLERYDRRRVDGLWMHDHEVDHINAKLLSWDFHQRVANPCIGQDRADLVLAGCAILQAIRNVWPARRLRVADRGLREGLLTEMMSADGAWRRSRYRRGGRGRQR